MAGGGGERGVPGGRSPGAFPKPSLPPSVQNEVVPQCDHRGHVTSVPVTCVVCNPHERPHGINIVNSAALQVAIRYYSSSIQLRYCSLSLLYY